MILDFFEYILMNKQTKLKINAFQKAMDKYNNCKIYSKLSFYVSISVVILQLISLFLLWGIYKTQFKLSSVEIFSLFIISYVVTDFINGLIHMYMDNNSNYESLFGPLIAAFHLHHKKPRYKKRHPLLVYFYESGAKLWLPFYLFFVIYIQINLELSFNISFCLVATGILSSFAEVSHYWCHNSNRANFIVNTLQKYGVLLSKSHHKHHHCSDNTHYAFLNGITDPIINLIAAYLYNGYKNTTDIHVNAYEGPQTYNR
jgi:hypothetical protein